jgi:hypothetical protein
MKTKSSKTSDEIRLSIFKKIGYSIEYQDLEIDGETGDELTDSEEGYVWIDSTGNRSDDLCQSEEDSIEDCLSNIDIETECQGVKLTKIEKAYIAKEYNIEI